MYEGLHQKIQDLNQGNYGPAVSKKRITFYLKKELKKDNHGGN